MDVTNDNIISENATYLILNSLDKSRLGGNATTAAIIYDNYDLVHVTPYNDVVLYIYERRGAHSVE